MRPGNPRSDLANEALAKLVDLAELWYEWNRQHVPSPKRSRSTSNRQPVDELILARAVGIVESYLDSLLVASVEKRIPADNGTVDLLVREFEINASSNWQNRTRACKNYLSIDVPRLDNWKAFNAAIDVRNSIAHGLGALTARQRRNSQLASQLDLVDVKIANGRMVISATVIGRVLDVCRSLIIEIESKLP